MDSLGTLLGWGPHGSPVCRAAHQPQHQAWNLQTRALDPNTPEAEKGLDGKATTPPHSPDTYMVNPGFRRADTITRFQSLPGELHIYVLFTLTFNSLHSKVQHRKGN